MDSAWYRRPLRVLQFNFEDREGLFVPRVRGEDIVRLARELHANAVAIFARDAWGRAFYDSRVAPKHGRLGARDLVAEVVREARRYGIRVLAMVAHTTNPRLFSEHPDWAQARVENAYRQVVEVFNWDRVAALTRAVYQRVAEERARTSW